MPIIASTAAAPGYPPNCVGHTPMTKILAEDNFDTQRSEIAKSWDNMMNPPKASYTWPVIGLLTSIIATAIVCRTKGKIPKTPKP